MQGSIISLIRIRINSSANADRKVVSRRNQVRKTDTYYLICVSPFEVFFEHGFLDWLAWKQQFSPKTMQSLKFCRTTFVKESTWLSLSPFQTLGTPGVGTDGAWLLQQTSLSTACSI